MLAHSAGGEYIPQVICSARSWRIPGHNQHCPCRTAEHLLAWDADVIVLDEDWLARFREETVGRVRRRLEAAGYAEQFAVRERAAGRWMAFLCSGLSIDPGSSNLGKIDPALAIWVREHRAPAAGDK